MHARQRYWYQPGVVLPWAVLRWVVLLWVGLSHSAMAQSLLDPMLNSKGDVQIGYHAGFSPTDVAASFSNDPSFAYAFRVEHVYMTDVVDLSVYLQTRPSVQRPSALFAFGAQLTFKTYEVAIGMLPNLFYQSDLAIHGYGTAYRYFEYPGADTAMRINAGARLREISVVVSVSQPYLEIDPKLWDQDNDGTRDPFAPQTIWSEFDLMVVLPVTRALTLGYYFAGGYTQIDSRYNQRGHAYAGMLDLGGLELATNGVIFENVGPNEQGTLDNDSHISVAAAYGFGDFFTLGMFMVTIGGGRDLRSTQTTPEARYDAYDTFLLTWALGYSIVPGATFALEAGFQSPQLADDDAKTPDGSQVTIEAIFTLSF